MSRLFGRVARATFQLPDGQNFEDAQSILAGGPAAVALARNVLTINGSDNVDSPGLRMRFKITKTSQKDPNDAELVISNLNPDHRAHLQSKGIRVSLDAGYQDDGVQRIFLGDSRTTDQVREGGDWNTTIRIGDGTRALRNKRFKRVYGGRWTAGEILTELAGASGLMVGNAAAVAEKLQKTFQHGYSVNGPVSESIDRLLKSLHYGWSVQYGTIYVLARNASLRAPIPEISPSSGLIGSPEMGSAEKKGGPRLVKFKSLLFPANPGFEVKLVSERYDGLVRIKKSELEGDTVGGPWFSTVWGVIVDATNRNANDQVVT